MKKNIFIAVLLVFAILFAFTACPTSPTTGNEDDNDVSLEGDAVLAAIVDNVGTIVKDVLSDEEVPELTVYWSKSPIVTRSLSSDDVSNLYAVAVFSGYSLGDSSLIIASGSMSFEFSVSSTDDSGSYSITRYEASVSSSLSIEGSESASVTVSSITGIKGFVDGATVAINDDDTVGDITVTDEMKVNPISSTISAEIEIDGEEIEASTSVSGLDDEVATEPDDGIIDETGAVSLIYWDSDNATGGWVDSELDSNNTEYSLRFEFDNGKITLYVNDVEIGSYEYDEEVTATKITNVYFNSENNGTEYTVDYGIPVITAGGGEIAVSTSSVDWSVDRTAPKNVAVKDGVITVTTTDAELDDFYRFQGVMTAVEMEAVSQWTVESSISFDAEAMEVSGFAPSVWLYVWDNTDSAVDYSIIRIESNAE